MIGLPGAAARRRAGRMIVAAAVAAALAVSAAACGDAGEATAGIVVALDASGGQVTGFTLRTAEGETLVFEIGDLETDGAAFPASHLSEHAVTLQPIAVGYRVVDGRNVAHRLVDAPWAAPTS